MRVLLTGQSGLQIEQMFRRFSEDTALFPNGHAPHFLKVEEEMARLFRPNEAQPPSPAIWVRLVLAQPIGELRDLWARAFEVCLKKAKKIASADPNALIVLNMHAAFYHSYTVEYISLFSTDCLSQFKPDIVITLIDDAYDIHDRLREPQHIFHPSIAGAPTRVKAAFQLLRILDWRSKEIMVSRQIAYDCDKKFHFVFATKHSKRTFYNLVAAGLPCVYLSHPISQVRRLLRSNDAARERAYGVIRAVEEIEHAAARHLVLFSPTTIDELRIRSEEAPNTPRRFLPEFTERWNSKRYEHGDGLVFLPPKKVARDPLWSTEGLEDQGKVLLAPILEVLADEIGRQISARDHKLVEQCPFLIVYRPFFAGNASSGVRKELDYFKAFKDKEPEKRFCFIVMPEEDSINLKVQFLEDRVREAIKLEDLRWGSHNSFGFTTEEWGLARARVQQGTESVADFLGGIVATHGMDFPPRVSLDPDFDGPRRLRRIAELALRESHELIEIYKNRADYVDTRAGLSGEAIIDVFLQQLNIHRK